MAKQLIVFLEGERIGVLTQERDGKHTFTYDLNARITTLLSLSMPRRAATWVGKPVETFIDGLLPDDRTMRQRIARHHAVYDGTLQACRNRPFSIQSCNSNFRAVFVSGSVYKPVQQSM